MSTEKSHSWLLTLRLADWVWSTMYLDNALNCCSAGKFSLEKIKEFQSHRCHFLLISVLWKKIICLHCEEIWALSLGNAVNGTLYPFEDVTTFFKLSIPQHQNTLLFFFFTYPTPQSWSTLIWSLPQDLPNGIQRPLYPILNGAQHILSRLV